MVFFIARIVCTTNWSELASAPPVSLSGVPGTRGFRALGHTRTRTLGASRPSLRLGAAQCAHLMWSELAYLSRLHIQLQRTVAHALDLLYVMPDLLKHAPDLPVLAFGQRDLVPRIGGVLGETNLRRRRVHGFHVSLTGTAADADSTSQLGDRFFRGLSADLDQICF